MEQETLPRTETSLLGKYMEKELFSKKNIPAYPQLLPIIKFFDDLQKENKIFGGIAEIGVAQGKFFVPLALCCRRDEVAVAIDVFDDAKSNWNPAGGSSPFKLFKEMIDRTIQEDVHVSYIEGDSFFINHKDIIYKNYGNKFRLFSVDGAHSAIHTINDLKLAGESVVPGGIIFLDDIQNWGWPGVIDGFARYMLLNDYHRLVPFFLMGNKLLLTTPSHHEFYLEQAIEVPKRAGRTRANVDYRISEFFGYRVLGY